MPSKADLGDLRKVTDAFTSQWDLRFEIAGEPGRRFVFTGAFYDEGDKTLVLTIWHEAALEAT